MGKFVDLTGMKFSYLTVLGYDSIRNGRYWWLCQCDCGNKVIVPTSKLKNGHTKSCGCFQKAQARKAQFKDITGNRYGHWTVLSLAYKPPHIKSREVFWNCICDCGTIRPVSSTNLRAELSYSCGCITSKGEEKITKILDKNNIMYIKEKSFKTLKINNHSLKFDYAILGEKNEVLACIEYQGIIHYKSYDTGWFTNDISIKMRERDALKVEYCKENNIPLVIIPYTDYDILDINYITNAIDNATKKVWA